MLLTAYPGYIISVKMLVKSSFVIFDIRALWRSELNVRVLSARMSKITNDSLTLAQDALWLYSYGNSIRQRVKQWRCWCVCLSVCLSPTNIGLHSAKVATDFHKFYEFYKPKTYFSLEINFVLRYDAIFTRYTLKWWQVGSQLRCDQKCEKKNELKIYKEQWAKEILSEQWRDQGQGHSRDSWGTDKILWG